MIADLKGADVNPRESILFSGGAPGAEAAFGGCAEHHGVEEVNFTFDGHKIGRHRGVRVLNHEELQSGDVSLEYVSRLMRRRYTEGPTIRKVLQTLWYQVNSGQEIYVIGTILGDGTVRGGTGWGAEFAKFGQFILHLDGDVRAVAQCGLNFPLFGRDQRAHFGALRHIAFVKRPDARHLGIAQMKFIAQPAQIVRRTRHGRHAGALADEVGAGETRRCQRQGAQQNDERPAFAGP